MQRKCPITSINITGNSTLQEVDNSQHFFVGEAIVAIQDVDQQLVYLNNLISLDSSDLSSAILSVDTTILNDTSIHTFSVNISA